MRWVPTIASRRRSIGSARSTPDGVLKGDLVLVANADLTLGGRDLPDGTIAFTNFDHTESNSLGSSILTDTDPLAGLEGAGPAGRRLRDQARSRATSSSTIACSSISACRTATS